MRKARHPRRWLAVLALALVLVPLFLHGHDHGSHDASASAPCAACTTSQQPIVHASGAVAAPAPRLVVGDVRPVTYARHAAVDRATPVGRGPPSILLVAS
jgi:hypothetical protein